MNRNRFKRLFFDAVLPKPQYLHITASDATTITYAWTNVLGADGYEINIYSDAGLTTLLDTFTGITTPYVYIKSVSTDYFAVVRAYKGTEFSAWSNEVALYDNFTFTTNVTGTDPDKTMVVTPTGGTQPYRYSINTVDAPATYQASNTFMGLADGTYYVYVQDAFKTVTHQTVVVSSIDPNAQAFITAYNITDPTEKAAVNFRVLSLKGLAGQSLIDGVSQWGKIICYRPYVGGTKAQHEGNLKDPTLYEAEFFGGWTHDANGITGNATDTYCDEGFVKSLLGQDTIGYSCYSRTAAQMAMPVTNLRGDLAWIELYTRYTDDNTYTACANTSEEPTANTDGSGTFIITRQSALTYNLWIRGTKYAKAAASVALTALQFDSYCVDNGVTQTNFTGNNLASEGFFNASLTDTESTAFETDEVTFQTMLSRNV